MIEVLHYRVEYPDQQCITVLEINGMRLWWTKGIRSFDAETHREGWSWVKSRKLHPAKDCPFA
jgi:hypothetical protein